MSLPPSIMIVIITYPGVGVAAPKQHIMVDIQPKKPNKKIPTPTPITRVDGLSIRF